MGLKENRASEEERGRTARVFTVPTGLPAVWDKQGQRAAPGVNQSPLWMEFCGQRHVEGQVGEDCPS